MSKQNSAGGPPEPALPAKTLQPPDTQAPQPQCLSFFLAKGTAIGNTQYLPGLGVICTYSSLFPASKSLKQNRLKRCQVLTAHLAPNIHGSMIKSWNALG